MIYHYSCSLLEYFQYSPHALIGLGLTPKYLLIPATNAYLFNPNTDPNLIHFGTAPVYRVPITVVASAISTITTTSSSWMSFLKHPAARARECLPAACGRQSRRMCDVCVCDRERNAGLTRVGVAPRACVLCLCARVYARVLSVVPPNESLLHLHLHDIYIHKDDHKGSSDDSPIASNNGSRPPTHNAQSGTMAPPAGCLCLFDV